jgi:phosphoribosylformimino-5-aminoimidazole carboxamide ribotide isomerase
MNIIPAIDLIGGQAVRLMKGDYNKVTVYSNDPTEVAKSFQDQGAQFLHIVDLDGAKEGSTANFDTIRSIVANTDLSVEVGGGIRTMKDVDFYIQNGIERVIIGSAALKNPQLVKEACKEFGDRIAVGIDAKNEMVATEGWTEKSDTHYIDLAKRMEDFGVKYIIFTDIDCDGMLSGPNLEQLIKLNEAVTCNITASGGIRDIQNIIDLKNAQMYGAICGRSIYSGTLNLVDAIKEAK